MGFRLAELFIKEKRCNSAHVVVVDYFDALYRKNDPLVTMERVFPLQNLKDGEFDVIIASAIIEHLPEPRNDINILFSKIVRGGYLYCRMPYAYPLFKLSRKIGMHFDMLYPGHMWDFSPEWYYRIIQYIESNEHIKIIVSRPSIAETTFKQHFFRALITHAFKMPWIIWHGWSFVGGWEAIYCNG